VRPLWYGTRCLEQVDAEQLLHTTSGHCEVVAWNWPAEHDVHQTKLSIFDSAFRVVNSA
jgi:hypothetical protein